ncbi:MAG: alpha amylase catalytic region [Phycisphaerales bacterium]|nr:alpha amylase catalytic region [Phycisphaerales bacterium]
MSTTAAAPSRPPAAPAVTTAPPGGGPVAILNAPAVVPRAYDPATAPAAGRSRVILENLVPLVDGGRFAARRSVGETVVVEVDAFTDGHDKVAVALRHRPGATGPWQEVDMAPTENDRWAGAFEVHAVGDHEFTVAGWVDRFGTWRYDLNKRVAAGQDVGVDLAIGAAFVEEAAAATEGDISTSLAGFAVHLRNGPRGEAIEVALGAPLEALMRRHAPRHFVTELPESALLWVDREKARFSSWYELFPRSASFEPGKHGTFKDVIRRLDYVAEMGFDVLYLPPIHPIGRAFRKGKNNSPTAEPGDVGSPWAIGGPEGGHDAIHPDLGTIGDFEELVKAAAGKGIEVALDIAFQCSPDHPYVKQHPEWFKHRPDGTIQYAENPPKKYQDIYPFDFECDGYMALWDELVRVVKFWNAKGVRVFRVDNPHTKPFPFWEYLIAKVKAQDPGALFLAEAFTRPKVMYRLGKVGFTQSYTYFAWRNDPVGLKAYLMEVTQSPVADFFRPNVWPNTPDILPEYLQTNNRAAYVVRAVLAATLSANYGLYGPAFELIDSRPVRHGSEEYMDSEKYQLRHWDGDHSHSLAPLLARLNQTRKANPALQHDRSLKFHTADNGGVVVYSKRHGDNAVLVIANTDPYRTNWSTLDLDLSALGVPADEPYQVHDVLTNARYRWQGNRPVVKLDPNESPAHLFVVRRRVRTEHDFEYFA